MLISCSICCLIAMLISLISSPNTSDYSPRAFGQRTCREQSRTGRNPRPPNQGGEPPGYLCRTMLVHRPLWSPKLPLPLHHPRNSHCYSPPLRSHNSPSLPLLRCPLSPAPHAMPAWRG